MSPDRDAPQRLPVGFIIVLVLAALYLIVRFVQMGAWVVDWLTK